MDIQSFLPQEDLGLLERLEGYLTKIPREIERAKKKKIVGKIFKHFYEKRFEGRKLTQAQKAIELTFPETSRNMIQTCIRGLNVPEIDNLLKLSFALNIPRKTLTLLLILAGHGELMSLMPQLLDKEEESVEPAHSIEITNINVADKIDPHFVDAGQLLENLKVNLQQAKDKTVVIHGLGKVGKTQLVIEYINKNQDNYKVAWWIDSATINSLKETYGHLGVALGVVEKEAALDVKVEATRVWLKNNDEWLVVFDNVIEPGVVESYINVIEPETDIAKNIPSPFLPFFLKKFFDLILNLFGKESKVRKMVSHRLCEGTTKRAHILITSRHHAWEKITTNKLEVKEWSHEQAIDYLKKHLGDLYNENLAEKLAKQVDYLPSLLKQAAVYIETTNGSLGGYLKEFQEPYKELQNSSTSYWQRNIIAILVLLSIGFIFGYVFTIFGGDLPWLSSQKLAIQGIPLRFWLAHNGAIYIFILLTFVYVLVMKLLDKKE